MKARTAAWLVWPLCVATVTLAVAGLSLASVNDPSGINKYSLTGGLLGVTFPLVGALIASRHPGNPIGWIFCAIGFSQGLDSFATAYATRALITDPGSLPAGGVMAWLSTWTYAPGFGLLMTYSMLLFPDGHLLSRRWIPVAWLSGVAIVLGTLPVAVATWQFRGPILMASPGEGMGRGVSWALGLQNIGFLLMLSLALAAALSVLLRFLRSHGPQRQQLKLFTYSAVIGVLLFVATFPIPIRSVAGLIIAIVVSPLIPVATGVAILRYRLYDIDLIINRTLVYGALTALLVSVYVMGVVGVGGLVRALTGERSSDLAVAASTLAVAGLFQPLRRRIQGFIDRRFYRHKYDATRTLEAFSSRLRDEVDLETLTSDLLNVVTTTMQPDHASIWLSDRMEEPQPRALPSEKVRR